MCCKQILFSLLISLSLHAQKIVFESKPVSFTEDDIRKELSLYPANILNLCVEKIEVKDIHENYYGMSRFLLKSVEINSNIPNKQAFIRTIHHELSSMFLLGIDQDYTNRTFKIYQKKFNTLNPNGFRYDSQTTVDNLNNEQQKYFAYSTYSMTSFENDFNVISETLFTDPYYLNQLHASPPVYQKLLLVVEFYHNYIDSKFTIEYFKNLKR